MAPELRVIEGGNDKTSRFYNCSICGRRGKWGPSWSWYGSENDLEWGLAKIVIVCSDECKVKHRSQKSHQSDQSDQSEKSEKSDPSQVG